MITLLKNIVLFVSMLVLAFSCKNDKSLQQFMVNNQENPEAITFDLSANMLSLKENMDAPENKEILKSIKKANILAFKIDTLNGKTYENEKQQLKEILKGKKYNELMRSGKGSNGVKFYTVGDENAIDEIIIYGNENSKGWGIVRITGNNMQPDQILKLMKDVNWNDENLKLDQFSDLLKDSSDK